MDKKLVFFYEKNEQIAGSILFYLKIAHKIAEERKYDKVYYVNYRNTEIEKRFSDNLVAFCDVTTIDFNKFEGADFVVPLNYIFPFLIRIQKIKIGRLLLFDWHPQQVDFLANQFLEPYPSIKQIMCYLRQKKAIAYMDGSCKLTLDKYVDNIFTDEYVPVFSSDNVREAVSLDKVSSKRISVGWLGRLDSDKINSLINLLDNLYKLNCEFDIHIIGDGKCRNQINIAKYSPKIRFIFCSYLTGEYRDNYIRENVDVMFTMGISALDCANLSVPTVIAPLSFDVFRTNAYVFLYDSKDYCVGWTPDEIDALNIKSHTIQEILDEVFEYNGKSKIGVLCHDYAAETFNIDFSVDMMLSCINQSNATIDDLSSLQCVDSQLHLFKKYKKIKKPFHRDYFDFLNFISKRRRISNEPKIKQIYMYAVMFLKSLFSIVSLIKNKVKNFIVKKAKKIKWKKQAILLQNSFTIKAENIREKYAESNSVPVAFIVIFSSVFPSEPVFQKMINIDCFDPYIIVSPDMERTFSQKNSIYEKTYKDLCEKYGCRVIHGYDTASNNYLELKDNYPIVFFNNPYSKKAHKYHYERYFRDKDVLSVYINYGFFTLKFGRKITSTDFYSAVWKVCIDSYENYKDLKHHQAIRANNALVTGYIKMDNLAICERRSTKKMIIIAPHHTIMQWKELSISNFLTYYMFFVELPKKYPDIDFVFRPHPLLFPNLIEKGYWTEQEVSAYLEQIRAIPNMRYDDSADYLQLFTDSDAMIHDCGSYIGEYLFTEKPCCYIAKTNRQLFDTLLPMGKKCMDQYYKAYSEKDIMRFIEDVVISGKDPLKESRESFARKSLKFNYPNSTQILIDTIRKTIDK